MGQLTTSVELDAEDLYALTDGIAFGLQYLRGIYGEGRIEALHRRLTEARRSLLSPVGAEPEHTPRGRNDA